jgi:steroid 5-alpha reductase family enzyme
MGTGGLQHLTFWEKMNSMRKEDTLSLLAIPLILLIGIGAAWAGSQGGYTAAGIPIFALDAGIAFLIQWLAFMPAYARYTQAFYDLTGSIANITVTLVALLLTPVLDARSWLLACLVVLWAARLGYFLFTRIRRDGEDRRFREILPSFPRFLMAWTLQGLWVILTLGAALAAITSTVKAPPDLFLVAGFLVWLAGFTIEVVSDHQKRIFKARHENKDRFIQTGLWIWSRHPNYFGEIVLWIGVAVIAFPALHGWQYVTLVSPIFVAVLLTKISGIPMLEAYADQKWGGQPEYEAYKAGTSTLIPRPPK